MFVAGKAPVEHIFFHTNYFYDSLRKPIFCLCGAPMSQVSYLSHLVSLFFFLLSFPLPPSPPHRPAARISPSLYCQVSGLFASFPPIFTCLGKHRCQTFVLIMRHFFASICLPCDCNTKMNISWKTAYSLAICFIFSRKNACCLSRKKPCLRRESGYSQAKKCQSRSSGLNSRFPC